ncbi:unnamed protein product, partial [Closterium sp. NIES-54]
EALAAKTAAEKIPAFNVIDTVIRTVAEHLGRSGPWHQRFMGLQEVFTSTSLELQGIHAVRWLSRGDAVLRLVAVLPALIVMLKEWDATLYALVTSYKFHFLLFFIADVLEQLNILNRAFQHKEVSSGFFVHAQIKRTTSHIESRYVDCGDEFGGGVSELLSPFIARHGPGGNREVKVEGIDSDGRPVRFKFVLHEDELEEFEGPGTHDGCVEVCTQFAEVIVHQLEHRLGDLNGMSGARLFTPDEYPLERGERNRRCLEWLQSLVTLFKADLTDEILPGIDKRRAEKELRMFTSVLAASTKGERGFHAGLTAMLKTPDWRENYPNLVLLWVAVSVLPLSTVECERGFSRQNIIKSWNRGALKDARLGDLIYSPCCCRPSPFYCSYSPAAAATALAAAATALAAAATALAAAAATALAAAATALAAAATAPAAAAPAPSTAATALAAAATALAAAATALAAAATAPAAATPAPSTAAIALLLQLQPLLLLLQPLLLPLQP